MATVSEIQGVLKLRGGAQFSRQLRSRLDGVKKSFTSLNTAIAGTGLFLAFRRMNEAANTLSNSNRKLAATSKLTGIDLNLLERSANNAKKTFSLSTKQANELTIELGKLGQKAGDISQLDASLERLLDLAAARGYSAEQALVAIQQALLGIDEGTDKLFGKNPSAIYAEYAKQIGTTAGKLTDQQKAQALLNAVITDGQKVQGEYQEYLKSAAGQQARFNAILEEFNAIAGRAVQQIFGPFLQLGAQILEWFNKLSPSAQRATLAIGAASTALWFLRGVIQALLPALGPVGWLALGLSAAASFFGIFSANADTGREKIAALRAEIRGFNIDQLKMRLQELNKELALARDPEGLRGVRGRASNVNTRNLAEIKKAIAETEKELNALEGLQKLKQKAGSDTVKVMTKEEKDLLDEQLKNQYEHGVVSRDIWLNYLRNRLNDFKQWSDEWTDIHDQILALEKEKNAARLGEEAKLQQQTLEMRGQFLDRYQEMMDTANTSTLDKLRDNMNQMQALVQEKVFFISDAFGRMGDALGESFANAKGNLAKMQLKGFFKEILLSTLEFIQRFYLLAKIKNIIESTISLGAALKSVAPLIAANALLEGVKGQIAAMANGSYVTAPTLALVGEAGQPEIVAPERDFMSYSNMLIDRVLNQRPNNTVNHGGVTMVNNFNTPLQDRRMARLLAEQNSQQVKREMKRSKRYLNQ